MKSAIIFALAMVPALTGILDAAEPLSPPQIATTQREALPKPAPKTPPGPPIGLVVRVYEMDTGKNGPNIDFRPQKEDRKTVNTQFETFRKSGFVRVLAEPHLVTQDGRPATMLSGGEVPVLTPAGKDSVEIDWLEFGTRIELTPRRVRQERVQIRISAEFTRRAEHGLAGEKGAVPVVVGRTIKTAATLGPKDIIVLNDREAIDSDEPGKVVFMTIELAQAGVEAALLQFDGQAGGDAPAPPRDVPARAKTLPAAPPENPPTAIGRESSIDVPDTVETGGQPAEVSTTLSRTVRKKGTLSAGSFFLKPGKTQLELTRGTWRSITIPSKDFSYGSSMLVESPDDGAVSISGRILTPQLDGPAKTDAFEAGESGEKYFADIWTIKGTKAGIATIRLIDGDDQEYELEVTVKGDTRHFDAMVKRFHPKARVEAHELTAESIIITGEASADDSVAIREIAEQIYETVLLRLKTQPAPAALLDGPYPGPNGQESSSTYPNTGTDAIGETGQSGFSFAGTTEDSYSEPSQLVPANSGIDPGTGDEKASTYSTDDGPSGGVFDLGLSSGEYGSAEDQELVPAGGTNFDTFTESVTKPTVTTPRPREPSGSTTQVRFLHSGFISMQTEAERGSFIRVNSWDSWQTCKNVGGNFQQIRYSSHRENIPQGSQTRFQFRTTEFRDDVWVNAVLVTAAANEKTRYFLQHFPVDLILEQDEVVAAARGQLVSRFVVMKDPRRAPLQTRQGETVEPRESFAGPNSFQEALVEGRKQGQVLAILVLGPEAMLQRDFAVTQSNQFTKYWNSGKELNPLTDSQNLIGDNARTDTPGSIEGATDTPGNNNTGRWVTGKPAGSVSTEMRQLRQEVRSLREQLGRLVEVLSRENPMKPEGDRLVPAPLESTPEPVERGSDGFDRLDRPSGESTPVPLPKSDHAKDELLPPPTPVGTGSDLPSPFEPELPGDVTPTSDTRPGPGSGDGSKTPARKPILRPSSKSPFNDEIPVESESVPNPKPVPIEVAPTPSA